MKRFSNIIPRKSNKMPRHSGSESHKQKFRFVLESPGNITVNVLLTSDQFCFKRTVKVTILSIMISPSWAPAVQTLHCRQPCSYSLINATKWIFSGSCFLSGSFPSNTSNYTVVPSYEPLIIVRANLQCLLDRARLKVHTFKVCQPLFVQELGTEQPGCQMS